MLAERPTATPDVILIATGSEVALALAAARELAAEGVAARVVSMPCWELFEEQPPVLPRRGAARPTSRARLAVEAGVPLGWERYVGGAGDVLGLDRFGASAPGKTVLEKLGLHRRERRRARAGLAAPPAQRRRGEGDLMRVAIGADHAGFELKASSTTWRRPDTRCST